MFKKLAVLLVALLAFGGTVTAYAWWDTLEAEQLNETITIGEGATVTLSVTAEADAGKTLVPDEALLGANDVKSYVIEYTVVIDKDLATPANLAVSVDNIQVDSVANPFSLINVNAVASATTIDAGADVVVTITVTMSNPADATQYAAVAGKDITFDLTVTAS